MSREQRVGLCQVVTLVDAPGEDDECTCNAVPSWSQFKF